MAAFAWLATELAALSTLVAAAAAAGHLILKRHPFESGLERAVFTVATGLGAAALTLFAAGLAGALDPRAITAATIAVAVIGLVSLPRPFGARLAGADASPSSRWRVTAMLAVLACWLVLFALTLYPPNEWDAISHHLVLARYYLEDHRVAPALGVPYPVLPALHHMLIAWALVLGGDATAQATQHVFLVLLAAGMFLWGRRLGHRALAFAFGAFPLGQPLMVWLSGTAYLDLELTAYVWLGFYALRVFRRRTQTTPASAADDRWWYLGMALLACAGGVRFQGLFFLGWAVLMSLFWRMRPATLAAGWLIAAVVTVPWYGYIAYHTGDPFWPAWPQTASGMWGSPQVIADAQVVFWSPVEPRTIANFLRLPFDQVVHSRIFQAETNPPLLPLLMLWPIAWLVSFRDRSVRWWTLPAFAYLAFWFSGLSMMRFWLPAVPLAGAALYESLDWLMTRARVPDRIRTSAWMAVAGLSVAIGLGWTIRHLVLDGPVPATTAAEERFKNRIAGYAAVRDINARAISSDIVYVINASWLNYYLRPRVIDYVGILQHDNWPTFRWPADRAWVRSLDERGARWILVRHDQPVDVIDIPPALPDSGSFWPTHELVYQDEVMWTFRRRSDVGLP